MIQWLRKCVLQIWKGYMPRENSFLCWMVKFLFFFEGEGGCGLGARRSIVRKKNREFFPPWLFELNIGVLYVCDALCFV